MKNGSVHIPLFINVLLAPTKSKRETSPPAPKHTAGTGSNLLCIPIFFIGVLNGSVSSGTGLLVTILLIKTFKVDFLKAVSLTFFTVGIFWNAIGAFFLSRIGSFQVGNYFI